MTHQIGKVKGKMTPGEFFIATVDHRGLPYPAMTRKRGPGRPATGRAPTVKTTLDKADIEQLKVTARERSCSVGSVVRLAIREYLAARKAAMEGVAQ